MKGKGTLIGGVVAVLAALLLPFTLQAAYADEVIHIERLLPAESAEVETGGGEAVWMVLSPYEKADDTFRIERLLPAESGEVEVGAGETPGVLLAPTEMGYDTGRIELLLPAK